MNDTLSVEHFSDICRFCLTYASRANPQFPLFLHHGQYGRFSKNSNESMPEIITSCLGLKINPDDGLPLNICTDCETELTRFNQFRTRSIRSVDTLIEIKNRPATDRLARVKSESKNHVEFVDYDRPDTHDDDNNDNDNDMLEPYTGTVRDGDDDSDYDQDDDDDDEAQDYNHGNTVTMDSDEEYEADLADKYESLDQQYHIADAPSLSPEKSTIKRSAPDENDHTEPQASTSRSSNDPLDGDPSQHPIKPRTGRSMLPKQCYVCGLVVPRMRDHMKCHPGELKYQCELCPRTYLTKTGRDRHIDAQHPETRYTTTADGTLVRVDRAYRVRLQRTLRYAGKEFVHRNGIVQSARRMRPGCDPRQCRFKCATRLTDANRQRAFDEYYALADLNKQWQYLAQHFDRTVPKVRDRKRVYKKRRMEVEQPVVQKKRQNNIRYFLYADNDCGDADVVDEENVVDRAKVFVCKTMFLATFDIGETSVATALQKTDVDGNLIDFDRRGRARCVSV